MGRKLNRYYACGSCKTYIAKLKHSFLVEHSPAIPLIYFRKADNLRVHRPPHYRREGNKIVTGVSCIYCEERLGIKIVRYTAGVNDVSQDGVELPVDTLILHLFKLKKKKGRSYVRADED